MAIETKPWDAAELLETPADIAAYLEDSTTEALLRALSTIAHTRGMSALAQDICRNTLPDLKTMGLS